jgi:succinate dehydrogenase/fumarate reductase flavoprotein subunit
VVEDGAVVGLVAEHEGRDLRIRARKAVILGVGGFEWNPQLVKSFLRGPMDGPGSTPENEGDGLLMAMAAGASLGLMSEAWWMPTIRIPGEDLRGRPVYRLAGGGERAYPGGIMVNREGRRFVNEACNYSTLGRAFHEYDTNSTTFRLRNLPCWLVFDQRYQDRYPMRQRAPGGEGGAHMVAVDGEDPPEWVLVGRTLGELAAAAGIDAAGLAATVERFNGFAREGRDPDFHRGESAYDTFMGDRTLPGAWATLGRIETPPFYAVEMHSGTIGTKGGPRTNDRAQVLDTSGAVIPGLYAIGNTMASATGLAYFGAGCTIGMGMTFGYVAGRSAAQEANRSG